MKPFFEKRNAAVATGVLMYVALLSGCTTKDEAPVAEAVRPAYVTEARAEDHDILQFVGEVRATRRADLAFAVSGRLMAIEADVGDTVRTGQLLARIDTRPLAAQLAASEGDAARAEAQVTEARQRLERVRVAQRAGATSPAEATAAENDLATAEAVLRSAVAQRGLARWSLEHATLRSPVDGVVAVRSAEPGQSVGPGTPLLAVDGAGRELSILVPGDLNLKPGNTVTLRSGGTEAVSRVLRIAGRLESGGVRRVFVSVPDQATVGSTWSAALALNDRQAPLQVPLRAILPDPKPGHGHLLRLARDGRTVEKIPVRLGAPRGEWIEVLDGLTAGDRVIIAGAATIRPGSIVKPVPYTRGAGA